MKKAVRTLIFSSTLLIVAVLSFACKTGAAPVKNPSEPEQGESSKHEDDCEWEKTFGGYTWGLVDTLDQEVKFYSENSGRWAYWSNNTFRMNVKADDEIEISIRLMADNEFPEFKYEPRDIISKDNVKNLDGEYVNVKVNGTTGSEWHFSRDEWENYNLIARPVDGGNEDAYNNAEYEKIIYYYDYNNGYGVHVISEDGTGLYVKQIPPKDSQLQFFYNMNSDWKGCNFENIKNSNGFNWSWGDDGKITGVDFKRGTLEQKITIKLTETDAEKINQYGLLLNGYGVYVTQIKIPGKVYNYKTLEAQYLMKREERNDFLENYRTKTGWKEPFVVITTKDAEKVVTRDYYESIIDIVNVDDDNKLTAKKGQVKVRGNSTADIENPASSKPIRIKFDKKHNMMGLHDGKKYKSWVLLNVNDGQDYMGFSLANEIYKSSPEFEPGKLPYFASDCTFVHLFINEKYEGMRLLCEQSQINSGRVEVSEFDETDPVSQSERIGYMIELDNYSWAGADKGNGWEDDEGWHFAVFYKDIDGNPIPFTDVNDVTYTIKVDNTYDPIHPTVGDGFKIKNDIYNQDQVKFIRKVMNGIWQISYYAIEKGIYYEFDDNYDVVLSTTKKTAEEACSAVIDLESLCNEIILEELVRDNDVGVGSLNMAIDFTKTEGEKYNKLTFECPWDFNWAYEKVSESSYSGAYWLDHPERLQYFAGAWIPEAAAGCKDRTNVWFMLYTKAPWFREMLRARWNAIGKNNLSNRVTTVMNKTANACTEGNFSMDRIESFLADRIPYIEKNLWVGKEAYLQSKTE